MSQDQRSEARESIVYGVVIALCFSLMASLLLKVLLLQMNLPILTSLATTSRVLGAMVSMMVGLAAIVPFVVGLRWLLPLALSDAVTPAGATADFRNLVPFRLLSLAFGVVGILVVIVSIFSLRELNQPYWAKFCAYLQLVPTVGFSAAALLYPGHSGKVRWGWLRHSDLEGPESRLVWLLTDLLCFGLFFGLLTYQASISNLLYIAGIARPELSDDLYIHGLRLGMLLAIWFTPATQGGRTVMTVAFLVDWLAEKVVDPNLVPLLQFVLVWIALAPFHAREEGLKRTIRLGFGLCAGRVLGRVLGALFLGEEGPILLEPISELVVALWLFPDGLAHGRASDSLKTQSP